MTLTNGPRHPCRGGTAENHGYGLYYGHSLLSGPLRYGSRYCGSNSGSSITSRAAGTLP